MAAGLKDGVQGAKSKSAKQFGRLSSSVGGGGLVLGIAAVVVVGVAGKLLSKLRKSSDSLHNNTITPNNSVNETVNGEYPKMLMHLEDGNLPLHAAVINGKSVSSLDLSGHKFTSTSCNGEDHSDADSNFHTKTSPEDIDDKTCSHDLLHLDSVFIKRQIKDAKDEEDLSTASTALSELVNNALADAKHDSPSKHKLLNKTKALQEGFAGVISRAFEDFNYADLSGDELMPMKVELIVSWETNSCSGSEEETSSQDHPGDLVAEKEVLQPSSTPIEADKQKMERINHDAPANQDEKVPTEMLCSSSALFEEQEEPKGTIARNEIEKTLHEEAGSSLAGNEVVMAEVEKERFESERLDVSLKDDIKVIASLLDDITTPTTKGSRNNDETVKKERTTQEGQADNEAEIFTLTSILLRSNEGSATEVTAAKALDAVQISTQIAEKKEGTPVTVTSLILPATSHEISHTTKIVAKDSTVAGGIRKTAVVTIVEFISSTAGVLKRELEENWRGPYRSSLEVLGLAFNRCSYRCPLLVNTDYFFTRIGAVFAALVAVIFIIGKVPVGILLAFRGLTFIKV